MKRLRALLMVCVMCVASVCLWGTAAANDAEPLVSGDYQYTLREDGTALIIRYTGSSEDVTIPSSLGGVPVTALGPNSFESRGSLLFVEIPEGITSIGDYAFRFCNNLEVINLPDSLVEIGKNPFTGCEVLEEIDLISLSLQPFGVGMRPVRKRGPEESILFRLAENAKEEAYGVHGV